ncbi:hypothetical protein TrRE_jg3470 [Triparma retinervis]|uniref:Calcineurin-like phosphoesterase domain-containing protein n=1 Tax=Triparma retinervis TaxID=2557542 RepID=A0A9W7E6R4_9STRA|nr:hypothetical protein TrRE_jg3470 [Triparma retinervis]
MRYLPLFLRALLSPLFPSLFPCFSSLLLPHPSTPSTSPFLHAVLPSPPSHIYCVGDIHGCHDEFLALLSKIKSRESGDPNYLSSVILVGDLVNKGPDSLATLRYCRSNRVMSVLGNHDLSALRVYRGSKPVVPRQAGKYKWVEGMSEADARYLEALPCTISLAVKGRRYVVVHAGLVPGVPLGEQDARAMTTMRLRTMRSGWILVVFTGEVSQEGGRETTKW